MGGFKKGHQRTLHGGLWEAGACQSHSNDFKEKEAKPQLDPAKITDILGKQSILRNELYTVISLSNVFVKNIKTVNLLLLCYFLQNS